MTHILTPAVAIKVKGEARAKIIATASVAIAWIY